MASKTTRKTTSLNSGQLRSLETSLADAYNLAGLNDISYDRNKQQRNDVIGNIDNPSYSVKNKTKIENFKRHLSWKLKDAKVEGITNLESFFDAIEKSRANLSLYPNLANLKENLSTKVTVESPPRSMPPTRNVPKALPPSSSRSTVHIASERGHISFPGSGSPLKSNIPSPPPNYLAPSYKAQAEEKAKREAEAKARHEAEEKARREAAKSQANQDIPSLWHSFATSLNINAGIKAVSLQQNDQNTNQQARPQEKTDDKKENSLPNWMALVSGLLNQQGEKKKPEPSPQKNPPPIDTQREKPKGVQKTASIANPPIPQSPKTRAPQYYSHSLDIWRLQSKFDENHNISYNQIKNDKAYFDQRVAKWDAELKDIGLKTAPPRMPNEPRPMGFKGYIKYLDSNIKQLQMQELSQKELKSGENPSVNQDQLKTLIAFHYLEMAKAFYSSGELNMDKNDGDYQIKSKVFKGSSNYHEYLLDERMGISIDSYKLPKIDGERDYEKRRRIEQLRNEYLPNHRSRIESRNVAKLLAKPDPAPPKDSSVTTLLKSAKGVLDDAKESIEEGLREDYNRYGGARITSALNSAKEGGRRLAKRGGSFADAVAEGMVWTGRRADPAKGGVNAGEIINNNTGLGFANPNADAREHDVRIHTHRKQTEEFQPNRDTRAEALARRNEASKEERYARRGNPVLQRMYSRSDGDFRIREGAGNPFASGGGRV